MLNDVVFSRLWLRRFLRGAAASALGVTFLASGGAAFAEESTTSSDNPCEQAASSSEDVSAEAVHNGYCIDNVSPYLLRLNEPAAGDITNAPRAIFPGDSVYFELTYWWGSSGDDTKLVYTVWDGVNSEADQRTVTFHANQQRQTADLWTIVDASSCASTSTAISWTNCSTRTVSKDGEQTHFRYNGGNVSSIPVESVPVGMAVDDSAHRAYVANAGSNIVSVIDTTENKVVDTIALVHTNEYFQREVRPAVLAIDRVAQKLYAATDSRRGGNSFMVAVDLATGQQESGWHDFPYDVKRLAVDEQRHEVYLTGQWPFGVRVVAFDEHLDEINNMEVPAQLTRRVIPDIAIDSALGRMYVTDVAQSLIHVFETSTKQKVKTLDFHDRWKHGAQYLPFIAVDESTHGIYLVSVGDHFAPRLHYVDGTTDAIIATKELQEAPSDLTVDSVSHLAYGSSDANGSVSVFDRSATRIERMPVDPGTSIVIDPTAGRLLLANRDANSVSVLDTVR